MNRGTIFRQVMGAICDGVTVIFHWHNPSGCTMVLGSTQPLIEMSTRNISLGGKGSWCIGLTTLPSSCADCLENWEPQPSGSLRACPGLQWDCFTSSFYCLQCATCFSFFRKPSSGQEWNINKHFIYKRVLLIKAVRSLCDWHACSFIHWPKLSEKLKYFIIYSACFVLRGHMLVCVCGNINIHGRWE
jgi:hypothetical protein